MQAAGSSSERTSGPLLAPQLLGDTRQSQSQKKVHFDSTAVDNEYKMKSRQKRTSSISIAAFSQRTEIFPSSWTSTGEGAPNVSRTNNSPATWSLSTPIRPQKSRRQDRGNGQLYPAQPPRTFYPLTHNQAQASLHRVEVRESAMPTTSAYRASAKRSANSAAKREWGPRGKSASHVPPKVPEAPSRQSQRPPPAPRPSRLPTPDLMDLGCEMFCPCDASVYGNAHVSTGMTPLAKMDAQLEAARAYMKHQA
ncbi:hypothetical protein BKA64DRAFT_706659 [Cadophora sp. MPI-SDFR-AT-0126]|nr:hypothetical protein BKA64DRAFT_706659 [Leotiomycetes sp. MPI-SDFR-AT-0126]